MKFSYADLKYMQFQIEEETIKKINTIEYNEQIKKKTTKMVKKCLNND